MKRILFILLLLTNPCFAANRATLQDGSGNELGTSGNPIKVSLAGVTGDISSVGDVTSGAAFDGTQGTTLTFNNAGGDGTISYDGTNYSISKPVLVTGAITTSALTATRVTFAGTAGLLSDDADMTFATDTLTVTKLGATTLTGTIAGGGQQLNNIIIGTTTPLAGSFTTVSGSTSVTSPILSSNNADPADSGIVRLGNAELIAWEADAAGTDLTLTVNSSEQFVFSAAILSPTLVTPVLGAATYTTLSGGAVTDSSLTSGRVQLSGASGVSADDADLTFATDTLTATKIAATTLSGVATLAENSAVALDPAGSADGKYTGITIAGTAGATLAFGDLIYLDVTDSRWELADANAAAAADGDSRAPLGICVLAAAGDASATTVLLVGVVRADAVFPAMTVAGPVYVSETAGDVTSTQPTTTDVVIRVIGQAITADELYFNPDNSWTTHV